MNTKLIKPDKDSHISNCYVPHQVVSMMIDYEWGIARAWREHLGISQQELAQRLGVSLSTYSQQEQRHCLSEINRQEIAAALGIIPEQLDV